MKFTSLAALIGSGMLLAMQSGCVVPQPPGKGTVARYVESKTDTGYWLYLPEDYVRSGGKQADNHRWPMVITFHGTRPFDDAHPQIREWQQEADRYGFIVIAPELRTTTCFMQFPLRDASLPYAQDDDRATLAILDEVVRRTKGDPKRVLSTSWSSGGYLAHYVVNRHPERFSCLAVRESTFSEPMMNPAQTAKYHKMKVAIFFGENDFMVCRYDSRRAVDWYREHGISVDAKNVAGVGHQRIPQAAAAFYASTIGVEPKTPPDLADYVVKDWSRE